MCFHLLNSIAFAHILPVSLALFARIAPRQIAATVVGMYSMSFFLANALVGWIGSQFATIPTPTFWLIHAGLAGAAGLVFVVMKLAMSRRPMTVAVPA